MRSVAIGHKVDCSTAGPHTHVYHLAHAKTCQTFSHPLFAHRARSHHRSVRRQRHGNAWIAESFGFHSDDVELRCFVLGFTEILRINDTTFTHDDGNHGTLFTL